MPTFNLYPTPNPDGTDSTCRVTVIWNRGQSVYVGSTRLRDGADRHAELVPGDKPDDPYVPAWQGALPPLDRQQLNQLIETLRRARDQAYGKDA